MLPAQRVIFKQGDVGDKFYILVSGSVEVSVKEKGSKQSKVVATLTEGVYFGEVALILDQPRLANHHAHQISRHHLRKGRFTSMFAHNPEARSDFELRVLRDKVELYHILRHERGLEYFTRQLEKEYSGENIKFWKETHRYRHNTDPGPPLLGSHAHI